VEIVSKITKEELFKKYQISEGANQWDNAIDNWFSVEIYRQTHNGELPPPDDTSIAWVCDFIDKTKDPKYFFSLDNPGSHFTTAKRMVYRHADAILGHLST
jgi:hypothetical protein